MDAAVADCCTEQGECSLEDYTTNFLDLACLTQIPDSNLRLLYLYGLNAVSTARLVGCGPPGGLAHLVEWVLVSCGSPSTISETEEIGVTVLEAATEPEHGPEPSTDQEMEPEPLTESVLEPELATRCVMWQELFVEPLIKSLPDELLSYEPVMEHRLLNFDDGSVPTHFPAPGLIQRQPGVGLLDDPIPPCILPAPMLPSYSAPPLVLPSFSSSPLVLSSMHSPVHPPAPPICLTPVNSSMLLSDSSSAPPPQRSMSSPPQASTTSAGSSGTVPLLRLAPPCP